MAIKDSVVAKGLNDLCHQGAERYRVGLRSLKQKALYYFNLKRKEASSEALKEALQYLWQETYQSLLPVLNHMHLLSEPGNTHPFAAPLNAFAGEGQRY